MICGPNNGIYLLGMRLCYLNLLLYALMERRITYLSTSSLLKSILKYCVKHVKIDYCIYVASILRAIV